MCVHVRVAHALPPLYTFAHLEKELFFFFNYYFIERRCGVGLLLRSMVLLGVDGLHSWLVDLMECAYGSILVSVGTHSYNSWSLRWRMVLGFVFGVILGVVWSL